MDTPADPARQRLERLEGWLREDPRNAALLADTCDAALACGDAARAATHLQRAAQLGLQGAPWSFRAARLLLVQRAWDEAVTRLQALQQEVGAHPALAHDIGFAHWQRGDATACREAVAPWIGPAAEAAQQEATLGCQLLWLRAMHRLGLCDDAWRWFEATRAAGPVAPALAGVASLVAVDRGDFAQARLLADAALAQDAEHAEALVARASVALAQREPAAAQQLLQRMLQAHPRDGRAWSALGLALLQAGDAAQARDRFQRAVAFMPGHIGTWHGLGWSCLLLGDAAAALQAFQQGLALDGTFAESQGAVGLALLVAGRAEEAQRHLALADRLDRHNVTARYARALAAGQLREAGALRALAMQLLDRPGLFGGRLSDSLAPAAP